MKTAKLAALAWAIMACGFAPQAALGAEVTRVMDAFDGDNPWDGVLGLRFVHTQTSALILREAIDDIGGNAGTRYGVVDTRQLRSSDSMSVLNVDLRAGLWHDFELYLTLPFVIGWSSTLEYDDGVGAANSLVHAPQYGVELFPVPHESSNRMGLGDLRLGLKVAPFHEDRDPLNPSWVIGVEYQAPTGSVRAAGDSGVGSGVHALSLYTALSRRVVRWWEPYFELHGTLRFPDKDSPFQNRIVTQTAVSPGHSLGLLAGSEFYPWRSPSKDGQFVSIDLGFRADFTFEGREFTELFDALGTSPCSPDQNCFRTRYTRNDPVGLTTDGVTDVEQYGRFGLHVGVGYQPLEYLKIRVGFAYWHTTSHFLTFADAGQDLDKMGDVRSPNSQGRNEFNPFYNENYDDFGKRFRVDDKNSYQFLLSVEGQI